MQWGIGKSLGLLALLPVLVQGYASTDSIQDADPPQSGYLGNHPMDPAKVASSLAIGWKKTYQMNELFNAKPLVYTPAGAPNEYVIVVSNLNIVRVIDGITGATVTSRTLDPPFTQADATCGDVTNFYGIEGTPVIDPATDIMYFFSVGYKNQQPGSQGTINGQYKMYGVQLPSLVDAITPVIIQGNANNDPTRYFIAGTVNQRAGLAMLGDSIIAGFGGHCDNFNYTGMLVTVSKTNGVGVTNIQAMEASPYAPSPQGLDITVSGAGGKSGIWQSGMGLALDAPNNRVFFVTGNAQGKGQNGGSSGKPASGKTYLSTVEQAVANYGIDPTTGNLTQQDYFEPYFYDSNNGGDADFGSSGIALLDPTVFSCGSVKRIGVAGGKDGKIFILNADNLGGFAGGTAGADLILQTITNTYGLRSGIGSYPLEGGYIYFTPAQSGQPGDFLYAYKFSCPSPGNPVFTKAGTSTVRFAGLSVPTVTSNNGVAGSGIIWIADVNVGMLAFNAVPVNGVVTQIVLPVTTNGLTKYQRAVFGNGRVYTVRPTTVMMLTGGGGSALSSAMTCTPNPVAFGSVQVANTMTLSVTCTANTALTNPTCSISSQIYQCGPATLPATVASGASFTFPVTFNLSDANLLVYEGSSNSPLLPGPFAGTLNVYATAASTYTQDTVLPISGTVVASGGYLVANTTSISFGGVYIGGASPSQALRSVILTNDGSTSLTFTGLAWQDYYGGMTYNNITSSTIGNGYTSNNFPAVGTTIAAGSSITVSMVFLPSSTGIHASFVTLWSDGGYTTIQLTGNVQAGSASSSTSSTSTTSTSKSSTSSAGTTSSVLTTSNSVSTSSTVSSTTSAISSTSSTISSTSSTISSTSSTISSTSSTISSTSSALVSTSSAVSSSSSSTTTASTTKVASTGPSNLATIGTYSYVGCYTEATTGRALSALQFASNTMTIEVCYNTCSSAGYSWFGIEYHRECFCGNTLAAGSVLTTSGCTDTCAANTNEWCGGANRLSMYNNLNPVVVSSSSSLTRTTSSSGSSSSSSVAATSSTSLTTATTLTTLSTSISSTSVSLTSISSTSVSSTSTSSVAVATQSSYPYVTPPAPARHSFTWSVGWVQASPDGFSRPFVGINGQWPCPAIKVNMGDTVIITVTNNLGNETTAIHFHGIHQTNTTYADGPAMVTQCPIQPGGVFVYEFIVNQPGTYWYHAHIGGQYVDGFRGPLVINDVNAPYRVDTEYVMTLTDLYHSEAPPLINYYQSYDNQLNNNGAEPVPNSILINEAQNVQFAMVPGKKYLFRIINMGAFAPQYLQFDQHDMTVVEIDGVYTNQYTTSQLFITPAQRYSVIITAKATNTANFAVKASMSTTMFQPQAIPKTFNTEVSAYLVYNSALALPAPLTLTPAPFDDSVFTPYDQTPEFGPVTTPIQLVVSFGANSNGQYRGQMNGIDWLPQKVPTLYTAMHAPAANVNDPAIYGANSNSFVLPYGAVVELTVYNHDNYNHPFHLHGHNFQVVARDNGGTLFPINIPAGAPMRRDTVLLMGAGAMTLRFVANNPGIQLFHCHIEWHVEAGLTATFIEAPTQIQAQKLYIPVSHRNVCAAQGIPQTGNAAGNTANYENLTGAPSVANATMWGALVNPPSVQATGYPLS